MSKIFRQAVMAVVINEQGEILIGYSPRDKSYKFPQGGIERGEDIISGIRRELFEELNYELQPEFILEVFSEKVNYPFPPNCHPLYKGQELSIVKIKYDIHTNISPQDDEFDKMIWIAPHEITNYNSEYRAKAYFQALKICALIQ
ncbi:MAG: NUDIX hydrolase [Flavobacteriaceae bacterium]|nr:NUDIX hydrolase [Flavobacteriaceae bacterium]